MFDDNAHPPEPWETWQRFLAAASCAWIGILAVLAGVFQQLNATEAEFYTFLHGDSIFGRGGLNLIAFVFVTHFLLTAALFLDTNRLRATVLTLLLTGLSSWVLGAAFVRFFFPLISGTRSVL